MMYLIGFLALYGLVPLIHGHPLSHYVRLLCMAWEALDRGLARSAYPVFAIMRHNVREEWAKQRLAEARQV